MTDTITEENAVDETSTVTMTNTTTETTNTVADTSFENVSPVAADTSSENVSPAAADTSSENISPALSQAAPDPETDPFDKAEKERDSSGFFARFSSRIASIHSRREAKLVRDEIILSRIPDTDLMEYLKLEQKRLESQQRAREIREKRIWIAFQMTIALVAAVLVIYFLKDSPAILISILYTTGLLIAFNIWNKHKDKDGHSRRE